MSSFFKILLYYFGKDFIFLWESCISIKNLVTNAHGFSHASYLKYCSKNSRVRR